MKILFLCGSLNNGKDGVGDYTRKLAGELKIQGHLPTIIAIFENQLENTVEEIQDTDGIPISTLRIPYNTSYKQRLILVKNWVKNMDPEWISLQYVPFSFHKKGIPLNLGSFLKAIGNGRKWHLMFHELWVGMNKGSSTILIWWGKLQKLCIKQLLIGLNPHVIHTNTNVYQAYLNKLGYNADKLPIFSNIKNILYNSRKEENYDSGLSNTEISLVFFGSLHPGAPVKEFVSEISAECKQKNITINITILGRSGELYRVWASAFRSVGITVNILGEQTPEHISKVLLNSTIGITTTPIALIEKSGTIAAMREHGLPIICVSKPWEARGIEKIQSPLDVFEYKVGQLHLFTESRNRSFMDTYNASDVAEKFVATLGELQIHKY